MASTDVRHIPTPPPEASLQSSHEQFDIVRCYQQALQKDNEANQPIAAIQALVALLTQCPTSTLSELSALVERSTKTLKTSVLHSTALSAGTDLVQHYISSTLRLGTSDDFETIRTRLLTDSNNFIERAKKAKLNIALIGKRFIQDGSTVLTYGYSRVVAAVLNAAAEGGFAFQVILVEDESSPGYGNVSALASQLRKKHVPTAVIPFIATAAAISKATFAIGGANCILENGGIISSLGTRHVGILAKSMRKPFYIAAESHKLVREYALSADDLGLEQGILSFRTDEAADLRTGAASSKSQDALDLTEPELITAIVTERGVHSPSVVNEELSQP